MTTLQIWNSFEERLFYFILGKVKDDDVSKDLLHDVFEKIHLNVDSLQSKEKLESWLFAITRNTINDYFRKNKPKSDISNDLEFELIDENEEGNNDGLIGCLIPFLDQLPGAYQEVLKDYHFNHKSQKQIAEEKEIAYATVRSQIQRGRKILLDQFVTCCKEQIDNSDFQCSSSKYESC